MGPIHEVLYGHLYHQIFCLYILHVHGVGIFYLNRLLDHPLLHVLQDLFLQLLLLLHLLPLILFLQQQFHWDLHNAYFMGSYCEQSPIVCPKSIPKYKYLSASGVSVFANAIRFGLTCMSKIDGVCMLPVNVCMVSVASCPSFCFLRSKVCWVTGHLTIGFCGEATGRLLYATGHL